jgi:hypothetical protein
MWRQVIIESKGLMKGRHAIRGREAECRALSP